MEVDSKMFFKVVDVPFVVFAGPVTREICRSLVHDRFGANLKLLRKMLELNLREYSDRVNTFRSALTSSVTSGLTFATNGAILLCCAYRFKILVGRNFPRTFLTELPLRQGHDGSARANGEGAKLVTSSIWELKLPLNATPDIDSPHAH